MFIRNYIGAVVKIITSTRNIYPGIIVSITEDNAYVELLSYNKKDITFVRISNIESILLFDSSKIDTEPESELGLEEESRKMPQGVEKSAITATAAAANSIPASASFKTIMNRFFKSDKNEQNKNNNSVKEMILNEKVVKTKGHGLQPKRRDDIPTLISLHNLKCNEDLNHVKEVLSKDESTPEVKYGDQISILRQIANNPIK